MLEALIVLTLAPQGLRYGEGVDYWGDRQAARKKPLIKEESLWADRTGGYTPPKQVLQFLEEPTKENARAYLAWQQERMNRLKAASEVLREVVEESRPKSTGPIEILYFKRDDCPYCKDEDQVITALVKANPEIKVRTLMPKDEPALWREYDIKVVPSLVVTGKKSKVLIRGFVPRDDLVQILQEVNRV